MANKEIDELSGVETTGHDWDGIKELNNPLPRWWLWTFYITIVWSIGYCIAYPAIPMITKATDGMLGYSSRAEVEQEIADAKAAQADKLDKIASMTTDEIAADPVLNQFAVNGGRSVFKVYCEQCHGSGAVGAPGYPNLNDDDWIWGGSLEEIEFTLRHGVRYAADDDSRFSEMPAFGASELLSRDEIQNVSAYVRNLASLDHDADMASAGQPIYEEHCAACHGAEGKGDRATGAPNLTDPIWLYGSTTDEIVAQVHKPKHGVMPGWNQRLDDAVIKQLTLYVHSLGGGE